MIFVSFIEKYNNITLLRIVPIVIYFRLQKSIFTELLTLSLLLYNYTLPTSYKLEKSIF